MSWLAQRRNSRCQRDNSQSPRTIKIPHLAHHNFQRKDTIPNSPKIWIESFFVYRIPWAGGGAGDEGSGSDDSRLSLGAWIFLNTGFFFIYYPVMSHTYMAFQPELEWWISTKAHTHIFPENERLPLTSRLGGQEYKDPSTSCYVLVQVWVGVDGSYSSLSISFFASPFHKVSLNRAKLTHSRISDLIELDLLHGAPILVSSVCRRISSFLKSVF